MPNFIPLSDLKRRSYNFFEDRRPNKKNKKKVMMSGDMRSVPDLKIQLYAFWNLL